MRATSRKAAESIAKTAHTLRAEVFGYIRKCGARGATDNETQIALGMGAQTQTPRRLELERAGIVRDSGKRRKTAKGRDAIVWVVCRR